MTQEALRMALDALETELSIDWTNNDEFNASAEKMHEAIAAIKEALAQRTWVGLTEEDLKLLSAEWRIVYGAWMDDFARDIEAKLKEKNFV